MATNQRAAAIRRAHRATQAEMARYLREVEAELLKIWRQAGLLLQAEIQSATGPEGVIPIDQLARLRQFADTLVDQLARQRDGMLDAGLRDMIRLGVSPMSQDLGPSVIDLNAQVLRTLRAFVDANGLQLSDRVWRVDTGLREDIRRTLEAAVAEGRSASEATRDFMLRGDPVPDEIISKRERSTAQAVALRVQNELDGGRRYRDTLRVMRTEIIRAHGMAHRTAADAHPDVIGVKFTLSPNHPEVDICDVHASANVYGLGPGVYPTDRSPWPAHPNTMSYEQVVFRDEVTDEDRGGKETRVEWLQKQPDDTVRAVLGGGEIKFQAWKAGHVGERSIATPWRVLRERLRRQGVNVSKFEGG